MTDDQANKEIDKHFNVRKPDKIQDKIALAEQMFGFMKGFANALEKESNKDINFDAGGTVSEFEDRIKGYTNNEMVIPHNLINPNKSTIQALRSIRKKRFEKRVFYVVWTVYSIFVTTGFIYLLLKYL